jgi:PAS domain S-box-containing protein
MFTSRTTNIDSETKFAFLRRALDEHAIVATTDAAGIILSVNDRFCQISKYSRDELVGQNHRIINSGVHPKSFFVAMWRAISAGEPWHGDICNRAKDGSLYWVDTTIVPMIADGKIIGHIAIRADITARKLAEHNLKRAAADSHRLALIAQRTSNAVVITDAAGRIEWANEGFTRITGYTLAEAVGHKPGELLQFEKTDPVTILAMRAAIAAETPFRGEVLNRAKDGSEYWLDIDIQPLFEHGILTGFMSLQSDVTELKRLRDRHLEELNNELNVKNVELEQYVYSVSHDLKSPIVTILGFVGLLQSQLKNGKFDSIEDSAKRITRAAERMRAVIDDLLELSRVGRMCGDPEPVDLAGMVEQVRDEFAARLDEHHATFNVVGELPTIHADRTMIWQLFQNLVANAIHHGMRGDSPRIDIGCAEDDAAFEVYIRDDGPGIAPEHHERIFGLFQRLERGHSSGTGVGLAIVRRIAETYGGRAWVESDVGAGATFRVRLAKSLVAMRSANPVIKATRPPAPKTLVDPAACQFSHAPRNSAVLAAQQIESAPLVRTPPGSIGVS